ncbi:MAG TPA: asparagine synthase (glutamine-hydrolyzing) [Sandaracinaceae bacterium LLY-WYZ-13_1]|nr:asparagine synthase (glutamine-hydrolyzing) [Sandaracinaceae bacterium LLY-WYZ-13_1]
MCGIAGIVALREGAPPPEREALIRMATAMHHRGPDELGIYRDARAGLAHARLSIIDLATGQQPMSTADDTLHLTFNGEIYDYVELRAELEALGCVFRTRSDTEVILHAYRTWGDDAFARMNGQWALALWDARARRLVLSRDRVGIRPLHVLEHDGRLHFASEVKAIFAADPSIPRALDPHGLDHVFTFWGPVAPRSLFEGVTELEPGTVRTYAGDRVTEHAYWTPRYAGPHGEGGFGGSIEEATEAVREALEKATALRMLRADVTVGSYLSGGLDSSLVAALAKDAIGDRLRTFSLRFEDAEYDETDYQRLVAEALESDHQEVVVSRRDIAEAFPATIFHTERPILRTAPTPLMLLSRLVHRAGIKVVLTGEGADEMFAGYDLFREGVIRRFWARQPDSELRPRLLERLYPYLARSPVANREMAKHFFGRELERAGEPGFAHGTRWHSTAGLKRLFSGPVKARLADADAVREVLGRLPSDFATWPPLAQDQWLEIRTLMSAYILSSQGDRMLMASSVEGRFPFLDRDVVELANALPPRHKLRVLDEKHVLKRAARGRIPEAVLARKKQPYRAPDALSFASEGAPAWVEDALTEGAVAEAGVFDPRAVAQLHRKCRRQARKGQLSNADNMALVGVLSTQLLHAQLVREPPPATTDAALTTDHDRLAEAAR